MTNDADQKVVYRKTILKKTKIRAKFMKDPWKYLTG